MLLIVDGIRSRGAKSGTQYGRHGLEEFSQTLNV